jgi:4-amino-4-deoxychorismate lyase
VNHGEDDAVTRPDCWVDGQRVASIPVSDRGLQYGDGLFETIACRDGRPRFLDLHMDRLRQGCERLDIPLPDTGTLRAEIFHAAAVASSGIVKLIVTRGSSTQRGYAPPPDAHPRRIVQWFPWPPETSAAEQGVAVCASPITLGAHPALAGIKHLNRLEQVMARHRLDGTRYAEALMSTAAGEVIGGTLSNLFVVRGAGLCTPSLEQCGIAGVMRAVVLREAALLGLRVQVTALRLAELESATEMFLTNVRIGLWPIATLGSWSRAPGVVTRQLQARIHALSD